jgi:hypothetical protein
VEQLPAGAEGHVHAAFFFGDGTAPDDTRAAAARVQAPLVVLPLGVEAVPPRAEPERVRELADRRSVLVAVPDRFDPEAAETWRRLADRLGGTWRRAGAVAQYFNVMNPGRIPRDMLVVAVGAPGSSALFDQWNRRFRVIDAYPAGAERTVAALVEPGDDEGALLFLAGNTDAAAVSASSSFTARVPIAAGRDAVTVAARDWADRMPFPWSGLRDHPAAFRATAYRKGHAEFLFMIRANRRVGGLRLAGPPRAACRFVPWRFESRSTGEVRVVPLHDAAFAELPPDLDAGDLVSVWISTPVPAAIEPGTLEAGAVLHWDGGTRTIMLETEVLPVVLTDRQAVGFNPMGFNKDSIAMYYGWDDDTYYRKLPGLLRQWRAFGANTFALDVGGMTVGADSEGRVSVDCTQLERELAAVREAGEFAMLEFHSFKHLWNGRELAKIVRAHGLDDGFDAWEFVVPHVRGALARLGLEGVATCRHGDEIADYEAWLAYARLFQRCGVRMTVAINGYGVFNRRLAVGTMGVWIPLYNFYLNRWGKPIPEDDAQCFSARFRDDRRAAGEEVWPYVCGPGPYAWSSRPRSQARFLVLDTHMKGADGLSYYGGTVWSHALDPAFRKTTKTPLFDADCTFTTLFYPLPERDALLPSLRAGSFRIGIEDASAVQALRERAARAGRSGEVESALAAAYATLEMDAPQEAFEAFRRELARLWREAE